MAELLSAGEFCRQTRHLITVSCAKCQDFDSGLYGAEKGTENRMYNGVYNKEQYAYMYDTLTKWLAARIRGGSLGEMMLAKGIRKVALYGVSGLGELVYDDIRASGVEILCFIDKNADRYSGKKDGLAVLNLEQLGQLPQDCFILVIPEYFFREIMDDLLNRRISLENIISLSMVLV